MRKYLFIAFASLVAGFVAPSACADTTITVNLGPSTQDFIQYGLGPDIFGDGLYASAQGACSMVGLNTQCILSGSFTSSTAGFPGGSYSFVTTYAGPDTPDGGPNAPGFISNGVSNLSHYNPYPMNPSTSMVLTLSTADGTLVVALVTGGLFDPGTNFFFIDSGPYICTGLLLRGSVRQLQCGYYRRSNRIGLGDGHRYVSRDRSSAFNGSARAFQPSLLGAGIIGLFGAARRRLQS